MVSKVFVQVRFKIKLPAGQITFASLELKLAEMVILAFSDSNKDYRLYTDTSDQSMVHVYPR